MMARQPTSKQFPVHLYLTRTEGQQLLDLLNKQRRLDQLEFVRRQLEQFDKEQGL